MHAVANDIIAEHILTAGEGASLFLSGGSTPGPVYEALSKLDLPWDSVDVGLVDERWVDESDKGSNAALIRRTLLQGKGKVANFIPMKTADPSPQAGQSPIALMYKSLISTQSLAVLGMGTDGHICSWFPNSQGLDKAVDPKNKRYVQAITANKSKITGDYLDRMTLTLSALNKCKAVLLLISGDEKKRVFEDALNGADYPVSHLLKHSDNDRLTVLHAA